MAVQEGPSFKRYAANGIATVYTIPFLLLAESDLVVTLDGVVVSSGFTLTGIGSPESTATFAIAPLGDLLFRLVVPFERLFDYQENGDFLADTINDDYDRIWLALKELRRDDGRFIAVGPLEAEGIDTLPDVATRALKVLAFSASGDPVVSDLTIEELEEQPTNAAAAAAAAAASAGAASASAIAAAASESDAEAAALAVSAVFLTAAQMGLVGDGSDETAAVQAAITAAAAQRKTLIGDPSKTYKVTTQITGPSHTSLKDFFIDASAMTGTKHALVFQGTLGTESALTVNAAENVFSVTVADGSIFVAGEFCLLTVETSYYPFTGYNVARGEWIQVRKIIGNVVHLCTPLVQAYTTATTAKLKKCTFAEDIKLDNVHITGSDTAASNERGISFRFAKDFEVVNCDLTNLDQYSIEISSSIRFAVHHNEIRGTFYDGVTGTIFYGIVLLDACQYFIVHSNRGSRVRHLAVTTAASAGQGRWGQPMFGIIGLNVAHDCMAGGAGRSFAYEVHGTGQHLQWLGNEANGCYSFMRIEAGSDIQVHGGGCNGYAFQGLILGGSGETLKRIHVSGVRLANYTAEVTAGVPCAVRFETSALMQDVLVEGMALTGVAKANVGQAYTFGSITSAINVRVKGGSASAGDVESTGIAVSAATGASGIMFNDVDLWGWRGGYSLSGNGCRVSGGTVGNFATGGTGFGWYSNGTDNFLDGAHFTNINTPARMDTSSVTNRARFTSTGATAPNPSDAGTNNTGWELNGSATYDPPSLGDGVGASTTVTVTGAVLGDFVLPPSFSLDVQGITVTAAVSAANTISVRFQNETGGTIDLASGTLRARVIKK